MNSGKETDKSQILLDNLEINKKSNKKSSGLK